MLMFSLPLILLGVVSMSKMSVSSLITRWQALSRHTCIVLVSWCVAIRGSSYDLSAGRTGRAGKKGAAITFLTNDDDEVMYVPCHLTCFETHSNVESFLAGMI